jgi:hypothetical protein
VSANDPEPSYSLYVIKFIIQISVVIPRTSFILITAVNKSINLSWEILFGGPFMTASSLSFRLAVLFVFVGMAMGIGMAASQNHAIMPAHAHLNLLGWVSLFLFGIYYERRPALDTSRLALIQVIVWSVGTVVLTVAVAAIHLGYTAADPIAALASLIILAAMVLFGYFVFRPARYLSPVPTPHLTPAE